MVVWLAYSTMGHVRWSKSVTLGDETACKTINVGQGAISENLPWKINEGCQSLQIFRGTFFVLGSWKEPMAKYSKRHHQNAPLDEAQAPERWRLLVGAHDLSQRSHMAHCAVGQSYDHGISWSTQTSIHQILIVAEGHDQIVCTTDNSHAGYYMWSVSLLHLNTLLLNRAEDCASKASNKLHYLDLNIYLPQCIPANSILLAHQQHHCVDLNFLNLMVYNTSYYAQKDTDLDSHWSPLVTDCDTKSLMVNCLASSTPRCAHNITKTPTLDSPHQ